MRQWGLPQPPADSPMPSSSDVSPLTVNRLSVYLRCLRRLGEEGIERVSSQQLAQRFQLSATQIRKDLARFGEFGIRGVGYDVPSLRARLEVLLGLGRLHPTVIVGAGNIGTALARFLGAGGARFAIVGLFDKDPERVGQEIAGLRVRPSHELAAVVRREQVEIGILAVPAAAAQENCDALVAAGARSILNFAPVRLAVVPEVRVKTVDLLISLEELGFFLG